MYLRALPFASDGMGEDGVYMVENRQNSWLISFVINDGSQSEVAAI